MMRNLFYAAACLAAGVFGCVWVLLACLAYLLALGLFSACAPLRKHA